MKGLDPFSEPHFSRSWAAVPLLSPEISELVLLMEVQWTGNQVTAPRLLCRDTGKWVYSQERGYACAADLSCAEFLVEAHWDPHAQQKDPNTANGGPEVLLVLGMPVVIRSDLVITTSDIVTSGLYRHILRGQGLLWQYIAVHLYKDTLDTVTLLLGTRGVVVKKSDCNHPGPCLVSQAKILPMTLSMPYHPSQE